MAPGPHTSWFCLLYPERNAVLPADLALFLEGCCSIWLCTTLCPLDLDTAQLLGSTPGTLKTTPAAEQEQLNLDSQLRLVGVGPRVGHAEHPTACVGEVGTELIFERLAPVGLSTWNRRAQSVVSHTYSRSIRERPSPWGTPLDDPWILALSSPLWARGYKAKATSIIQTWVEVIVGPCS